MRTTADRVLGVLEAGSVALGLVLAGGAVLAHPDPGEPNCFEVVLDRPLAPGESVRVDDRVYEVVTRRSPGSPGAADRVEIDLLARYAGPDGAARRGSFVPGLALDYVASAAAGSVVAAGPLTFRLNEHGPSYGTTIEVAEGLGALQIELSPGGGGEASDTRMFCRLLAEEDDGDSAGGDGHDGGGPGDGGDDGPVGGPAVWNMRLVGSLEPRPGDYSNLWGWNDGTTFLAIVGHYLGTSFIDVTDPQNPVETGFIGGPPSAWREIKSYRHYAYIVTEGSGPGAGLQIVDLSNPQAPVLAATYATNFTTAHTLYIDTTAGTAWICGTASGMYVLDLEPNPVAPIELGVFDAGYVHDSYVENGLACLSKINDGVQQIADASNPASVQILDTFVTPSAATHNCWMNESQSLLVTTDETDAGHLGVYDITDTEQPTLLAEYLADPAAIIHNVMFDDEDNERLAISHYGLGLKYVDVHQPTFPVELGGYDTYPAGDSGFHGAWGVYAFDPRGYLYISDIESGFYLFEYEPSGGTLSGRVRSSIDSSLIAGAEVLLLDAGKKVVTGADGVYAAYAPAGDVLVRASAPGYQSTTAVVGDMPLGGRLDLDLLMTPLPGLGISGTLRSQSDLAPVEGAKIAIAGSNVHAISLSDGSFEFPQIGIGPQVITVERFGFTKQEASIVVAPGTVVDVLLQPAHLAADAESLAGFSLGAPGDTALSGIWNNVDPNGTAGGTVQPENDSPQDPGGRAFVTGQSAPGAGVESNDVDGGETTLLSPRIDLQGIPSVQLRYARWFSNNAGVLAGGNLHVEVSSDDGQSWAPLEVVGNANSWTDREFDLGSFIPLTDEVRLRFRADPSFGGPLDVVEAAVDAIEIADNCRAIFNPTAADADGDGLLDACDACALDPANDADGDGICGNLDNAPFVDNALQLDGDGDGVGDAGDNCPGGPNPPQRDLDRDGLGDLCDDDLDGDGLVDVLETDRDNDGVADGVDLCIGVPDAPQADLDADGTGDACDSDDRLITALRVDADRIVWEPESGAEGYNVYRGWVGDRRLVPFAECQRHAQTMTYTVDRDYPQLGDGYFYLVTGLFAGEEGPAGRESDGSLRTLFDVCP